MVTPDATPPNPTPEQLTPFDRAITNMQTVLDSSIRTRTPEAEREVDGMTRSINLGAHGVSEHVDENQLTTYRLRGTAGPSDGTNWVWVFDPQTGTAKEGREAMLRPFKQDPAHVPMNVGLELAGFGLDLSNMTELSADSYSTLTDQIPRLYAEAKTNKQIGYPRSRIEAAVGWLAFFGRSRS